MLHARLDDDGFDVGIPAAVSIGVVDQLGDLDIHASHSIDERYQVVEVHLGVMRDIDAAQFARFADDARSPIVGIGVVELGNAVPVDVDRGVARDGHQRHLVV